MPETELTVAKTEQHLGRLIGSREELLKQVVGVEGVLLDELDQFTVRYIPRIAAWDLETTESWRFRRMGLVSGGLVNIPLLAVVPKSGKIITGLDNLRVRLDGYDGDMELVPRLTIGFEVFEPEAKLITLDSFHLFSGVRENNDRCLGLRWEPSDMAKAKGRKQAHVFEVVLPEEAGLLFDNNGWLRDERQLEAVARGLSRRVDLDHLTHEEINRAEKILSLFKRQPTAIHEWLKGEFALVKGKYKWAILDGDINVEIVQLDGTVEAVLGSSDSLATIISIRDVLLPLPNSKDPWVNLVRPKPDSHEGTLKIIIYSDGDFKGEVETYGVPQKGYDTSQLVTKRNLAVLLAKMSVRP